MAKKKELDRDRLVRTMGQAGPTGQIGKEWVFQGVDSRFSNLKGIGRPNLMIRRYVVPTDPRTPPQLSWRAYYRAGCDAWNALSDEEKAVYNRRAKRRVGLIGFNLFMREWLLRRQNKAGKGRIVGRIVRGKGAGD